MKVILLERVEGWGALGDVVTVKDGYARNYLLPRSKALYRSQQHLEHHAPAQARGHARTLPDDYISDDYIGDDYMPTLVRPHSLPYPFTSAHLASTQVKDGLEEDHQDGL